MGASGVRVVGTGASVVGSDAQGVDEMEDPRQRGLEREEAAGAGEKGG